MKKKLLIALLFALGLGGRAWAAASDSLTVTVRPNAFYAVSIDTDDVSLDLGTVAMGASTQTVVPATITVQSTYASTDLMIEGSITSAGAGDWTFDDSSSTIEANKIAVWATFTSVARSTKPAQTGDTFSGTAPGAAGSDMVDDNQRYVGSSVSDGTSDLFECNTGLGSKDMDGLLPDPYPTGKSHLWLYFRMPGVTDDTDPQNIHLIITATAPN